MECEFRYQPQGWSKQYRFVALRYEKAREEAEEEESEQYQLFEAGRYRYRVFVTDMNDPVSFVVWFYNQRGGAENLIKEANNDAGLTAHPSGRFDVNGNHFSTGHAGLQPELLAHAVQSRAEGRHRRTSPHDLGHFAAALPVHSS
jgi:hypothetical protein